MLAFANCRPEFDFAQRPAPRPRKCVFQIRFGECVQHPGVEEPAPAQADVGPMWPRSERQQLQSGLQKDPGGTPRTPATFLGFLMVPEGNTPSKPNRFPSWKEPLSSTIVTVSHVAVAPPADL